MFSVFLTTLCLVLGLTSNSFFAESLDSNAIPSNINEKNEIIDKKNEFVDCSSNPLLGNSELSYFNENSSVEPVIHKLDPDAQHHRPTEIKGSIKWGSNGNWYPLVGIALEISIVRSKTGEYYSYTTTTNSSGFYNYYLPEKCVNWLTKWSGEEATVNITAYTETEKAIVRASPISDYYYNYTHLCEINLNRANTIPTIRIDIESDRTGHAFSVIQALYWGYQYARSMRSYGDPEPKRVTCFYPSINNPFTGDTISFSFDPFILLDEGEYACWDVVLHEYGHHLQKTFGCTGPIIYDSNHVSDSDGTSNGGKKENAIKLAWQEAWATVFAIQVTQYFSEELQDVYLPIRDDKYDSFASWNPSGGVIYWDESLETFVSNSSHYYDFGESCEGSVQEVLYDLYDDSGTNEKFDNVALGHKVLWDLVTKSHATCFSDFLQYANSLGYLNDDATGKLLSHFGFAAGDVTLDNLNTIKWTPSGDFNRVLADPSALRQSVVSNKHTVEFYDETMELIGVIEAPDDVYQVTITSDIWDEIVTRSNRYFYVRIVSKVERGPKATGPYFTERVRIEIPPEKNLRFYIDPEEYGMLSTAYNTEATCSFAKPGSNTLIHVAYKNTKYSNGNIVFCPRVGGDEAYINYSLENKKIRGVLINLTIDDVLSAFLDGVSINIYNKKSPKGSFSLVGSVDLRYYAFGSSSSLSEDFEFVIQNGRELKIVVTQSRNAFGKPTVSNEYVKLSTVKILYRQ